MADKKVAELIQRHLDGTLRSEEKLRLEQEMASDPETRRTLAELQTLTDALAHIGEVDPPPTLKPSIMREIQRRSVPAHSRQSLLARLLEPFRIRPAVRYALAVSGGIMVGIIGFALFAAFPSGSSLDKDDVIGTLSLGGSLKDLAAGPEMEVAGEGIRGTVRTESSRDFQVIHCVLESDSPAEVIITFDPARSGVVAAKNDRTRGTSILARDGEVRLTGEKGIRSMVLLSAPSGGGVPLHVSVKQGTLPIIERDLVVGGDSPG